MRMWPALLLELYFYLFQAYLKTDLSLSEIILGLYENNFGPI